MNNGHVTLHKSASRFSSGDNILVFPFLKTVMFVTFHKEKIWIIECFTHDKKKNQRTFFMKNGHLLFKPNEFDMGILLYASGMKGLAEYIEYLRKNTRLALVLVPARGGELEKVKGYLTGKK